MLRKRQIIKVVEFIKDQYRSDIVFLIENIVKETNINILTKKSSCDNQEAVTVINSKQVEHEVIGHR